MPPGRGRGAPGSGTKILDHRLRSHLLAWPEYGEGRSVGHSISDVRRGHPADGTLQNLLEVLTAKLELSARLPVLEYEAINEGNEACAAAFRRLAEIERRSVDD